MKIFSYIFSISLLGLMLWFPIRTLPLREIKATEGYPKSEGLGSISEKFKGAPETIRYLREATPGVVLEAQGNPYDYTTFIATLSQQKSYLGWTNHITLLTKLYDESGRREKVTKEIYTSSPCEERKSQAQKEGINYIVFGTLERQKYGHIEFSCLEKVKEQEEYQLFRVN